MHALIAWLGGPEAVAHWVVGVTVIAARIAPLTLLAPWLVLRVAPSLLRAVVTLVLALALSPLVVLGGAELPLSVLPFALVLLRELIVGAVFALAAALPWWALGWAGQLTDLWRGATLSEVIAAPSGEPSSPLGELYLMLGVVLFVSLGGLPLAIGAFADGLLQVPVGASPSLPAGVALGSAQLVGRALGFALALAAPVAAVLVLTELAFGLLGRVLTQLPLFFVAMPLRAVLGIAVALLALSFWIDMLPAVFERALADARELLQRFAP